jgi:ubiquinone/menaquinone biosynthesis C-methylase UbiE
MSVRLVRRLPLEPGMRVVDVGCGPGRLTLPVARAVGASGEVLATDLQREMLAIVERRAAAAGMGHVHTLQTAAGTGALPVERFDVALLSFVLGEIPAGQRRAAIEEISGSLRPGGLLVVAEGLMDPHRQRREDVLALTEPAGFEPVREDRTWTTGLLSFRKPASS